ncbi:MULTISPECIES: PatB family C-S lyase [Bacillaceae]|uniref:cysteine-S-conjugate beta-lyase n=1 Tax=Gottfriedia luciferensis TaxID=178774 RepID=A0ABX2ZNK1_9BACI|nr:MULTISPECIES: PatB family C-S lyase [Bacillaceae]ODG90967.1 cystathionine beta-lyase [Gottfriedia luciferensis]SFC84900.1 cystathione beta-lyase [Bacillus sp. UNCCL81]
MNFNFNEEHNRKNTNSTKWDSVDRVFGCTDVLPLWVADMDFACAPGIIEAITKRAQHPIYGYGHIPEEFFESAMNWASKRYNTSIQREWLTNIPGVVPALNLAIDAFTKPGDEIIIQPPVYFPFFSTIKNNGRTIVENSLIEEDGYYYMDLEDLENKITSKTKMIILCSPANPVGRVWTKEELLGLFEICKKNKIVVIADEIHADLVYEKGSHIPFYSLSEDAANMSITFMSPSKTFNIAGLFSSLAVIPNQDLFTEFSHAIARSSLENLNIFGIEAVIAAYNEGEKWLDELLIYLKGNAEFIHNYLKTNIPEVKMRVTEATYLGWLDFRGLGLRGDQLNEFMINDAKLGLNEGRGFGINGDGFMRLNYACTRKTLEEAMKRLEKAVKARKK